MEENGKRDIADYEKNYLIGNNGFEKYKVIYRRRKILEVIEQYAPKTILEIGCGLEPIFCYLKNCERYHEITIVEPAEKFYEQAKLLSSENKNVICIKGFFEEIVDNLVGKSYDMIVCSGLLHEVIEPEKLLNAIRKTCSENTIVHINVPNMYSIHRLLGVEMGIISDVFEASDANKEYQQNTNFDIKRLRTMIENNGLKVVEDGSYFVKPFSHHQMGVMMQQQIIDENVLDGLYHITKYMPQFGSEIYANCRIQR